MNGFDPGDVLRRSNASRSGDVNRTRSVPPLEHFSIGRSRLIDRTCSLIIEVGHHSRSNWNGKGSSRAPWSRSDMVSSGFARSRVSSRQVLVSGPQPSVTHARRRAPRSWKHTRARWPGSPSRASVMGSSRAAPARDADSLRRVDDRQVTSDLVQAHGPLPGGRGGSRPIIPDARPITDGRRCGGTSESPRAGRRGRRAARRRASWRAPSRRGSSRSSPGVSAARTRPATGR